MTNKEQFILWLNEHDMKYTFGDVLDMIYIHGNTQKLMVDGKLKDYKPYLRISHFDDMDFDDYGCLPESYVYVRDNGICGPKDIEDVKEEILRYYC